MKKLKRILALIVAIALFSLYGLTLVVSIVDGPNKESMLQACIYSTVVIPIFLWTYRLIYRVLKPDTSYQQLKVPESTDEKNEDIEEIKK